MWTRLPRSFVAVVAISTCVVGDCHRSGAAPAIELVDMPIEFAAGVTWSVNLFDEAGFDLPPLRYVFHGDDSEPCAGRRGSHRRLDGVNVIEICTSEMSKPAQGMILHETAHAWLDHALTDERKAAFRQLRGWTHWRNYDAAEWHDNGTEQAAEIMVWGLIDRPLAMVRIDQNSCDELDAGYRALTGRAPLHGFRDEC